MAVPFLIVFQRIPSSTVRILQFIDPDDRYLHRLGSFGPVLWHIQAFFDPVQGFINFLLFGYMSHSIRRRVMESLGLYWQTFVTYCVSICSKCSRNQASATSSAATRNITPDLYRSTSVNSSVSSQHWSESRDPMLSMSNIDYYRWCCLVFQSNIYVVLFFLSQCIFFSFPPDLSNISIRPFFFAVTLIFHFWSLCRVNVCD